MPGSRCRCLPHCVRHRVSHRGLKGQQEGRQGALPAHRQRPDPAASAEGKGPGKLREKDRRVGNIAAYLQTTCGTINLDYRSLYHHFENGVFFDYDPVVAAIRDDFKGMFRECREVTQKARGRRSIPKRVFQCLLRLFASLE